MMNCQYPAPQPGALPVTSNASNRNSGRKYFIYLFRVFILYDSYFANMSLNFNVTGKEVAAPPLMVAFNVNV